MSELPTIGSMCSGYQDGGLCELGLAPAVKGRVVWHAEKDGAASKVLAHHWPDTPNLGDLTEVDWATVPRVDWVTAGFPCQDVSAAGKRAGIRPGTRSGVWSHIAYAIGVLEPTFVLIENVEGLLSADAHSDLEPCPGCVGDPRPESVVRALGAVLGDLAGLGFDAVWSRVSAADAGAAHRRNRIFVLAAHPARLGRREGWTEPAGWVRGPAAVVGGASDADTEGERLERSRRARGRRPGPSDRGDAAPDARRDGLQRGQERDGGTDGPELPAPLRNDSDGRLVAHGRIGRNAAGGVSQSADSDREGPQGPEPTPRPDVPAWGPYRAAIERAERAFGRPAPVPVEPGAKGQPRLAARFGEWLMGLPDGHVTAVPGLSRNDQIKLCGNGVVPAQAQLAVGLLLAQLAEQVLDPDAAA